MFKLVVLPALMMVSAVLAQYGHDGQGQGVHQEQQHVVDYYAPPHYEFKYGVEDHHTGDVHSASESRDGDVVKGEYSLVEPDGTIRKVEYTADKHNGFNAVVTRSGHAAHPAAQAVHQPQLASLGHVVHQPVVASLGHGAAQSYANGGLHTQSHY